MWVLGETVSESLYTGATGETFTRTASFINGVATSFDPTWSELGGGNYRYTYTPAVAGSFEWVGLGSLGSPIVLNFDVETSAAVVVSIPATGALTKTLRAIRREIGRELSDCMVATATVGGASDQVFVDANHLLAPDHAYKGRTVYVTGGTAGNLLESRRVDDSSRTGNSVTFTRALPDQIQVGDEVELWGKHDEGWLPWDVNDTINAVIADGGDHFYIPVVATVTDAFDVDARSIAIPDTITKGFISLTYQSADDDYWYPVWERASEPGATGIWVNRGLRTIDVVGSHWMSSLDGVSLKIVGYGIPAALSVDTDATSVNKEWIVRESVRRLLDMAWDRKPEIVARKIQAATRAAEIARQRALMRPESGWVRL